MLRLSDERNFTRSLAGLALIIAPLLLLVGTVIGPNIVGKEGAERLPVIARNDGQYVAELYLLVIAAWVFVPGLVGLWRMFRAPGVTLGQVGTAMLLIGFITTIALLGSGTYEYESAQPGLNPAQMAKLANNVNDSSVIGPIFLVSFVLGLGIGSLIVAWSLWRRRLVAVWASVAIVIGTVLDIASANKTVAALAFVFWVVGFGAVGAKLLGMSDDEWDGFGRTAPA
jgi:hypothetical protein